MAISVDSTAIQSAGSRRGIPSERLWILYSAVTAAAILAYYVLPRAGVAQAVVLTVVNGTAAALALRTARRTTGSARVVWASLGSAMAFATLANGPYYAYPLITGNPVPFPCPVDVLWLLTYPCYVVALLALGKQPRGGHHRGDLLDAALLTVAGGTFMWLFVIAPVLRAPAESALAHVVSVAYPTMDLIVFAVLVRLIVSGLHRSGASRLLLGSFIALLVADLVYAIELLHGTYVFGGPTDGLWMASYALIGIAATHPTARKLSQTLSAAGDSVTKARLTFLCTSVLAGPFLLIFDGTDVPVVAAASALSFLLVMARLTGLNRRLASVSSELEHQAFHDSLTGLPNRALFHDRVEHVHRRLLRSSSRYAVLMLDLDGFKNINDSFGHGAGDDLLLAVSRRLADGMRPGDTAARLGGDEFGVILEDLGDEVEAVSVAGRLLDFLHQPTTIAERSMIIGATIGIALSGEATAGAADVVRNADIALYAGKAAGKDRYQLFNEEMHASVLGRVTLAQELRDGIARGELVLLYQPKVDSMSGWMVGVEALVRWNHPVRGLLTPDAFIGLAEEIGVIVDLDGWVLETACRQVSAWALAGVRPISISVNISGRDLEGPKLLERVRSVLDETGLNPKRLELELTESTAVEQQEDALSLLREIRALGVGIAIDDFGTGYSMLSRLHDFPIDTLKIDRSFVSRITRLDADSPIVSASVAMARGLDLEVVAEGVETEQQRVYLARQGCGQLQGYLISRPVEADRIPLMLLAPLLPPIDDPRWTALDSALRVASAKPVVDDLVRGLLGELQRLTGLDAHYLTRIDWARGEQIILFSHSRGSKSAPEGLVLPWPNTLSRTALIGRSMGTALPVELLPTAITPAPGQESFISVPVLLDDGTMFGTLCGASDSHVEVAHTGLQVMRIFASVLAAQLSNRPRPPLTSVHVNANEGTMPSSREPLLHNARA
jgi:diguanylate cyclase